MKTGRSLGDLAAEIERQSQTKRDYVAPTTALAMVPDGKEVAIEMRETGRYGVNSLAHGQIQEHVGIPSKYYDRMLKEEPTLLANNVNTWFEKYPAPRMCRTLDGRLRAFLSNSYRPLDNYDFASAILPVLAERRLEVMSCEVTERKLYIKAVDQQLFRDVPVGYRMGDGSHRIFDTCAPAFIASNSEVGYGRLTLETGVYTKACTNLALFADGGMKRTHVGARHEMTEGVQNIDKLLSDKTKQKTDEALWLQVRDVLKAAFNTDLLAKRVENLTAAAENKIEGKVEKVIEVAADRFGLNENERSSVLRHLIEGGSLSQYGLHAAFTRAAQDVDSYDRATEMEYMGGKIVELPRTEWAQLNAAA